MTQSPPQPPAQTPVTFHCTQTVSGPLGAFEIIDLAQAHAALEYAQRLGTALMVVHETGDITVEALTQPAGLERLQRAVGGHIEAAPISRPVRSFYGPYLGYGHSDGLYLFAHNPTAQALFGVQLCGPLAVEVGFSIDHHGDTVPTPIRL